MEKQERQWMNTVKEYYKYGMLVIKLFLQQVMCELIVVADTCDPST